jgi:hypothetical protein
MNRRGPGIGVDRIVRSGRPLASGSAGRSRRRAYIGRGFLSDDELCAKVQKREAAKRASTGHLGAPLVNLMTLDRYTLSLGFLRVKRVSTREAKQQQNDQPIRIHHNPVRGT